MFLLNEMAVHLYLVLRMESLGHHTMKHQFLAQVVSWQGDHAGQHGVADDCAKVRQLVGFKCGDNIHKQICSTQKIPDGETPNPFVSL